MHCAKAVDFAQLVESNNWSKVTMPISMFNSLQIRDLKIPNRVGVSPMCQYSAKDGLISEWHRIHLGAFATGGAGLVFV